MKIDNILIYNKNNVGSIVAFNVEKVFSQDVAIYLDKYNICVRAGNHCAKILNNVFNVNNTCRISLAFYNTKEEVDKFIEVIKKVDNIYDEINALIREKKTNVKKVVNDAIISLNWGIGKRLSVELS